MAGNHPAADASSAPEDPGGSTLQWAGFATPRPAVIAKHPAADASMAWFGAWCRSVQFWAVSRHRIAA
jgi:hypothetical protein